MTTKPKSIELYLVDGDPDGMLTATIPFQWTGHVLVTARTQLKKALQREEAAEHPELIGHRAIRHEVPGDEGDAPEEESDTRNAPDHQPTIHFGTGRSFSFSHLGLKSLDW